MLKKFLSTFIAVFTLITVVATSVYADFSITDFYPQTQELYSMKIDDVIDENLYIWKNDDSYIYEDPETEEFVMQPGKPGSTASVGVRIFPGGKASDTDSTGIGIPVAIPEGDYLVISFDMSKTGTDKVFQMQYGLASGSNTYNGPYVQWKNSDLTLTDTNNDNTNIYSNLTLADETNDNYHNFAFVIDSGCESSLYIDGVLVKENMISKNNAGKSFNKFEFYFAKNSSYNDQTVKLKNFKAFTAKESGIVQDIKAMTASNFTTETPDDSGNYVLTQDLTLPTTGDGGSTITWTSSNEAIISSEGKIHRHSGYEKSDAVTLTAKIVNGEVEVSKNFTFYVKRKDFPVTADVDGDYIVYDDFSASNLNSREGLTKEIVDGELLLSNSVSSEKQCMLYFNSQQTPLASSNKYVVEYDMKLNADIKMRIDIMSDTSTSAPKRFARWWKQSGDGSLTQEGDLVAQSDGKQLSDADVLKAGEYTHFKYLIDPTGKTYSLYVDGALLVKDAHPIWTQYGLGGIEFAPYSKCTINLDNLKVYKLADGAVFAPESSAKTISLNGENVSKIEEIGTYAAKLNITDYTTEYTDDTDFAVALYNKNTHELSAVKVVKAKALKGTIAWNNTTENYGLYAKTTIDVPADYENYYIKLMHWNGNVPVSSSVTVD